MKKLNLTLMLCFTLVWSARATETTPTTGNLETDKAALLEIYEALNGPNWLVTIEGEELPIFWDPEGYVEDYIGIEIDDVNGEDRVRSIKLENILNLEGEIPAAIGKLDGCWSIKMQNNLYLSGELPEEFYDLPLITEFDFFNTSISGEISDKIGNFKELLSLKMDKTLLTGGIPDGIGQCTKLEYLRLADNKQMTGTISPEIGKCTALKTFQVERSAFTGKVPVGLTLLPNAQYINLNGNRFSGTANFAADGAKFPGTMLELHENIIPFGDLLPMKDFTRTAAGGWYYRFINQLPGLLLSENTKEVVVGEKLVLDIDVLLPNHGGESFKWYKDGEFLSEGEKVETTMSEATVGAYHCEITTDLDILNSGICPNCNWQDAEATINPRPEANATNTTETISVTIKDASSIEQNKLNDKISIMNFHARGAINILTNAPELMGTEFDVIDTDGRIIKSGVIRSRIQHLSVSDQAGLYLLHFHNEDGSATKKLIIQ